MIETLLITLIILTIINIVIGLKKKVSVWSELDPDAFCEGEQLRNYRRNEMLIDLTKIPEWLQTNIVDEYDNLPEVGRSKLFNYFIKHKLKILMEQINEF